MLLPNMLEQLIQTTLHPSLAVIAIKNSNRKHILLNILKLTSYFPLAMIQIPLTKLTKAQNLVPIFVITAVRHSK